MKTAFSFACVALALASFADGNLLPERLRFAKETTYAAGKGASATLDIKPEWGVLTLEVEMKTKDVVLGDLSWKTARVPMEFRDSANRHLNPWPNVIGEVGTMEWRKYKRDFLIPKGAAKLNIGFSQMGSKGTVSFRNASLVVKRNRHDKPCNADLPGDADPDPLSLVGAWKQTSATRSRYSLNGLWQCRPSLASESDDFVPGPDAAWGWAKIPSVWERWGSAPFKATHLLSPWFEDHPDLLFRPDRAWYGRSFTMPAEASGRSVNLTFTMLNTKVVVYVDGVKAGSCVHPGGTVDITKAVKPGREQRVLFDFTAYPLNEETLDFNAPDRATTAKSTLDIKGITGDVYLDIAPAKERISNAYVETSVRDRTITVAIEGVSAKRSVACVRDLSGNEVKRFEGRGSRFTAKWADAALWDIHTPGNRYAATIAAYDEDDRLIDECLPFSFGFREVTLDGRDIRLNGKTIHLRALWCPTPQQPAALCCREACLETCRRLKDEGYNFIISGNYSFGPGKMSYYQSLLDACDECGILFSYTLPHMKEYGLDRFLEPQVQARYRGHCKWAIDGVRNHPAIISWAMNHNCTGYSGDMNPARMDGVYRPEDATDAKTKRHNKRNRALAHEAWKIAKAIDPTRPCYHHESGNLDDFHTVNIYLNWSPRQERSDWLEHWHDKGVKPLFFVEWGMPHISTWSSWRGPEFIWRNNVWQSLMAREGAAQFLGDAAYEDTPEINAALAHEEALWAKGRPMHWSTLNPPLRTLTNLYHGVQAHYMADNWRSHRAWGISAALPWDQGAFHRQVNAPSPRVNPMRYRNLKRPGIVPDEIGASTQFICDSGDRENWRRTAIGEVMHRWNMPDCAFIGGDGTFTDKTHIYDGTSPIRKTLVILNDNREETTYGWICDLRAKDGKTLERKTGKATVPPGGRMDVPVEFQSPTEPDDYTLHASFQAPTSIQTDDFKVSVIPSHKPMANARTVPVYDPVGLTLANFKRLGIPFVSLEKLSDLPADAKDVVVGRGALTRDVYLNEVMPIVRSHRQVLVFEQTRQTLEDIGFRVQEYGLRHANLRFRDPQMKGFSDGLLSNWAGASTLVPHFIDEPQDSDWEYIRRPWSGFMNTRVFRCGNRNAVATVIPEKPTVGDWRAMADGGFDLQYAPLLMQRVGWGNAFIIFCQFDVTGRTVPDPAADALVRTLVYGQHVQPNGSPAGFAIGQRAASFLADGAAYHCWAKSAEESRHFLVSDAQVLPDGFSKLIEKGAVAVCVGLDAESVRKVCPAAPACEDRKGVYSERISRIPAELNGLHNGIWAWHGAMDFAAFTDKVEDGNNAIRVVPYGKGKFVFLQVAPWMIDAEGKPYLRASKRHAQEMLERVMGNLGFTSDGGSVRYRDLPIASDDPYRYYRW